MLLLSLCSDVRNLLRTALDGQRRFVAQRVCVTYYADEVKVTDRILTEREYCELVHKSPRTAQRERATGDGPRWLRVSTRKIGYRESDVEEWLRQRTFSHRAEEITRSQAA